MAIWLAAALALALNASATKAEEPACPVGGDPRIAPTPIDWLKQPSVADVQWAFPPKAAAQGLSGRAVIACLVQLDGTLADCTVKQETPRGQGFGEAALSLAPLMRLKPATRCGVPYVGHVTVPLVFTVPEDPRPAEGPPPPPEAVAMARRVLLAMMPEAQYSQMVISGLEAQASADDAETRTAEQRRAVHEAAAEAWEATREETFNAMGVAVARQMDLADLQAIAAFYESPVGQRFVERQPRISEAAMAELAVIGPKILERFNAIQCQRLGNCDVQKALDALH